MSIMNAYRTWRPEVRHKSHREKEVAVSVVPLQHSEYFETTRTHGGFRIGGVRGSMPASRPSVLRFRFAGYGALHAIEQGSTYNK